jgi:hypothetical protein
LIAICESGNNASPLLKQLVVPLLGMTTEAEVLTGDDSLRLDAV